MFTLFSVISAKYDTQGWKAENVEISVLGCWAFIGSPSDARLTAPEVSSFLAVAMGSAPPCNVSLLTTLSADDGPTVTMSTPKCVSHGFFLYPTTLPTGCRGSPQLILSQGNPSTLPASAITQSVGVVCWQQWHLPSPPLQQVDQHGWF